MDRLGTIVPMLVFAVMAYAVTYDGWQRYKAWKRDRLFEERMRQERGS